VIAAPGSAAAGEATNASEQAPVSDVPSAEAPAARLNSGEPVKPADELPAGVGQVRLCGAPAHAALTVTETVTEAPGASARLRSWTVFPAATFAMLDGAAESAVRPTGSARSDEPSVRPPERFV